MQAIVFVRRTGADGTGHVGWGFETEDDLFNVGSIENPRHTLRTRPDRMGFWAARRHDPIAPMRSRAYTHFKLLEVTESHPKFAHQVVAWLSRRPYDLFGHNCMDATYDVLRAFGVAPLPAPAHHWEPNHWFNHIHGREYRIDTQDVFLERSDGAHTSDFVAMSDAASLSSDSSPLVGPARPSWRTPHTPEWRELQQAMAKAPAMPSPATHTRNHHEGLASRIRDWLGRGRAR